MAFNLVKQGIPKRWLTSTLIWKSSTLFNMDCCCYRLCSSYHGLLCYFFDKSDQRLDRTLLSIPVCGTMGVFPLELSVSPQLWAILNEKIFTSDYKLHYLISDLWFISNKPSSYFLYDPVTVQVLLWKTDCRRLGSTRIPQLKIWMCMPSQFILHSTDNIQMSYGRLFFFCWFLVWETRLLLFFF